MKGSILVSEFNRFYDPARIEGYQIDGVVDHTGEVFGYKGLYVADSSIIPRALGVSPSLTIAALAERVVEMIVSKKT
jgi:cholesterol oxidase